MKKNIVIIFSIFSVFNSNAQLDFQEHIVIDNSHSTDGARAVLTSDIDGDGDLDLLSASYWDDKIAWYENIDGLGTFGKQKTISTNADGARSIFTADLDGDGDMDVLSASSLDNKIAWYENLDGLGDFSSQMIITLNCNGAFDVHAADVDGDGDMDVLAASLDDDSIIWFENTNGLFSDQKIITNISDGIASIYASDIDHDGDLDIVSASQYDNKIAWYENVDGNANFGVQQIISSTAISANAVFAIDIDGDNYIDVLSTSADDNTVAWFKNLDGEGTFDTAQVISLTTNGAYAIYGVDLDNDNDIDVLAASIADHKIVWFENLDGNGNFGDERVISDNTNVANSVDAADLDGDGDMDVLSASAGDAKIAWYENIDSNGSFGPQQTITRIVSDPKSIIASDLNGDGDLDILSASYDDDKIAWYENIDGFGNFGPQQVISVEADGAKFVHASDLDGDGDMDVLSASELDDKLVWYENINGLGTFGPEQIIRENASKVNSIYTTDLDGDGDMDVLSTSYFFGKLVWYENMDGKGTFSDYKVITTIIKEASAVITNDLDGDGDQDVLSASKGDNKLAWYENDGSGNLGAQRIIDMDIIDLSSIFAIDIDGDGDNDVIAASMEDNTITWYENVNGAGSFINSMIITDNVQAVSSIFAIDMDEDGDMDILAASVDDDKVTWYENQDGKGNFGTQQVISDNANGAQSVFACDIDKDGHMDVISASDRDNKISWYENLSIVGVEKTKRFQYAIYPNPSAHQVNIQSSVPIRKVELYNLSGQLIMEDFKNEGINISKYDAGIYLCKIFNDNGEISIEKIIKE